MICLADFSLTEGETELRPTGPDPPSSRLLFSQIQGEENNCFSKVWKLLEHGQA